jgi:UDP-N-acetyl-D-glucosamine dehydrogenase
MELLARRHARFSYHDPLVPVLQASRRYDFGLRSVPLTAEALAAADVALIATDHSGIDYDLVVRHSRLVVDTRNATREIRSGREKIVLA